jgi:hypothetical protein
LNMGSEALHDIRSRSLRDLPGDTGASAGRMLLVSQQLMLLRRSLSEQLRGLESGRVKVLLLIDGGRTDEDATHERIEQLQACIRIIDGALEQVPPRAHSAVPTSIRRTALGPAYPESRYGTV